MSRSFLSCLALGFAGAALTGPGGLAALPGAAIAGGVAMGAAGGIATDLWKALDRRIADRWLAGRRGVDENHVVDQALRRAHLSALRAVRKSFDAAWAEDPNENAFAEKNEAFSKSLGRFIDAESTPASILAFAKDDDAGVEAEARAAVLAVLPETFSDGLALRRAKGGRQAVEASASMLRDVVEAPVLAELRLRLHLPAGDLPALFVSAFSGDRFPESWFDLFLRDGADRQKSDDSFARIWQAEQVAMLCLIAEAHGATLTRIADDTARISDDTARIADDTAHTRTAVDALAQFISELSARDPAVLKGAAEAGVERAAVIRLAQRIRADVDDYEQALLELDRAVRVAIDVARSGSRGSNLGAFVDGVLRRVAERSASGDFAAAAAIADDGFERWRREEEDRRTEALAAGLTLLDSALKQDILGRDAAGAAGRLLRKAELENPDPATRFDALRRAQDEWYVSGRDKGLNFDLLISIEVARLSVAAAADADERCAVLDALGNSLQTLGGRESGAARLEEAVAAYRAASAECSRERPLLAWATTQNNLGNALQMLGERENGTVRLEEAIAAYRTALEVRTRERVPLDWAQTQNNLGAALWKLGIRESGTVRLEEAVVTYRAALEERTRERAPLDWAQTQNNLGNALTALGGRESGTVRLEEAVVAYREALEEYTRERVPLDWAATQNNLGNALQTLGGRESGTVRLEEAVAAYRAALEEYTRERVPLDWATSIGNQGVAMVTLADRRGDLAMARQALAQIAAAFEEARKGGHAPMAAYYESRLPAARALVARLGG